MEQDNWPKAHSRVKAQKISSLICTRTVYEGNKRNSVNMDSPRLKDGQDDQLGEINDELNTKTNPLPSLDREAINEEHFLRPKWCSQNPLATDRLGLCCWTIMFAVSRMNMLQSDCITSWSSLNGYCWTRHTSHIKRAQRRLRSLLMAIFCAKEIGRFNPSFLQVVCKIWTIYVTNVNKTSNQIVNNNKWFIQNWTIASKTFPNTHNWHKSN